MPSYVVRLGSDRARPAANSKRRRRCTRRRLRAPLPLTAIYTGLRNSELCALRKSDVSVDAEALAAARRLQALKTLPVTNVIRKLLNGATDSI